MNKTKTQQSFILFVIQLLFYVTHNAAANICQQLQSQVCLRECSAGGFTLECPHPLNENYAFSMQLTVKTNEFAILKCINNTVDYNWLNGTVIGNVEYLIIENCPLPKTHLKTFVDYLHATNVKKLRIEYSSINLTVNDEYFNEMETITHLLMPRNNFSHLSSNLFEKIIQLTNLDLQDNKLNLENDVLAPLINLKILELGKNNIQYLAPRLFQNLKKLDLLNLWENKLVNLSKEAFVGLENLSSLDISSNQIISLPADVFSTLKNMRIINLSKNNIISLPNDIFSENKKLEQIKLHNSKELRQLPNKLFENLSYLQEINLSNCNISQLPEDLLWGTSNISKIDLSANSIVTVPELLFRDTVQLQELIISRNQIKTLEENVFSSLSALKILHLENNALTHINEQFHKLKNLISLYLNNNKLEDIHIYAFQEMAKLEFLNLSHNALTLRPSENFFIDVSSPFHKNINLRIFDLSHNQINEIFNDWMWVLRKLEILDLSYNKFTQITDQELQFLQQNKLYVNLQNNDITTINLIYLEMMHQDSVSEPVTIDFRSNKLICDCRIDSLLRYKDKRMKESIYNDLKLNIEEMTCHGPPSLRGHPIKNLNSMTFKCPKYGSQGCPNLCQCENWLEKKQYIVNCTAVGLTEVPTDISSLDNIRMPITLLLNNNSLTSWPNSSSLRNVSLTELSLSHNRISWIEDSSLPTTLLEIKLDNNNMTYLNSSFLEVIANRTNITLHNNPWNCDCGFVDFLTFLRASFKQVEYLNNITCADGRILDKLTADELCPSAQMNVIAASTAIAVVGIVIGLVAALYFRYQNEVKVWLYAHNMCLWFVREEELDKDKIYDAFISYSHKDEDFVRDKLLPYLENGTPSYKICIHYRDWIVGEYITTQIVRSVEDSKRTIILLSKNFVKSEWGKLEFRAAHKQALTERRPKVIVIIYGDIGPLDNLDSELKTYLSTNTYVKWGDPWFWDKLRYALPHQSKFPNKQSVADKLELINSSSSTKASTPPAEVAINPLEVIDNFPNKKCNLLNGMNNYTNNGFTNNSMQSV